MIKSICDMHIHTTCSDGELSPTELVEFMNNLGVKYFSVTDHDNVDFYLNKDALNLAKKYNMKYIVGCEFVSRVGVHPIEILGYDLDIDKTKKYLDKHGVPESKLRDIRKKYAVKIFKKLGSSITFSGAFDDPVDEIYYTILANPKLKEIILKDNPNVLDSPSNFLRKGLNNPQSVFFISPRKFYPNYKKLIKIIHRKFNGKAILAHPYHYQEYMDEILEKVKKAKIDGIECYHYTVDTMEKNQYLLEYAQKNKLLISGGSDFHKKTDIQFAKRRNMIEIPSKIFIDFPKNNNFING